MRRSPRSAARRRTRSRPARPREQPKRSARLASKSSHGSSFAVAATREEAGGRPLVAWLSDQAADGREQRQRLVEKPARTWDEDVTNAPALSGGYFAGFALTCRS